MSSRILLASMMAITSLMLLAAPTAVAQIPMDDLQLWLDASDPNSLQGSIGDKVEVWADLSGNGRDAFMANDGPTIGSWPLENGFRTVTFEGGNQALVTPGYGMAGPDGGLSLPHHIFIVEEYINTGDSSSDGSWYSTANPSSGGDGDLLRPLSTPDGGMRVFSGGGFPIGMYDAESGFHPEGPGIVEAVNSAVFGLPGEFRAFSTHRDGGQIIRNQLPFNLNNPGDNSITTAMRDEFPEHDLTIGKPRFDAGRTLTGSIAEFIVYHSELSPSEVQQVQDYLVNKWIDFTLPDGNDWLQPGLGEWSDDANWKAAEQGAGAPNDNTRKARFGDIIQSPQTVAVNSDVTVNSIEFNNPNTYAIAGPGSVNIDGGSSSISVTGGEAAGDHQFQVAVNLMSDVTIDVAAGSSLAFNNVLNLNGNTLTKTGEGLVAVNNVLNSGGGMILGVEGILGGNGVLSGDLTNRSGIVSPGAQRASLGSQNVIADVPEPNACFLLVMGLLGLTVRRRR